MNSQFKTNASVRRFLYLQQGQAHPQWEDYCEEVWQRVSSREDEAAGEATPLFKDWLEWPINKYKLAHPELFPLMDVHYKRAV